MKNSNYYGLVPSILLAFLLTLTACQSEGGVWLGEGENSFEFGLNAGVTYGWDFGPIHAFGGISSGPHFVDVETDLQARGFIFSDNFLAGLRSRIGSQWQLDTHVRFRHISNAGLQNPNKGIDNWLLVLGISRIVWSKGKGRN